MEKIAVILYGWPQPVEEFHEIYKFFSKRGYKVIAPYFLAGNDDFNLENVKEKVLSELKGQDPEVILGFSMGGLILPHIGEVFPKAKLVFVATGPYFRPDTDTVKKILSLMKSKSVPRLLKFLVDFLPLSILGLFYKKMIPFTGEESERNDYEQDMVRNLQCMKRVPLKKELQGISFVTQVNNRNLLKTLSNKAIIFSGKNDILMPLRFGQELKSLLKDSRLVVICGDHFNVFTERNEADLDSFLKL